MKTISAFMALALSLVFIIPAQAQSGMSIENWKDIKVGPMFTAGVATNAGTTSSGLKPGTGFAFSVGGLAIFPFSTNIGFDLALCYDARTINFHDETNTANGTDITTGYLAIRPGFNLGDFTIGLGIGVPMALTLTSKPDNTSIPGYSTSDMNMLFEGRIGGSIPVMETDRTELRLLIEGAYGFTQIIKTASAGPEPSNDNGPVASVELGLAYLFDLTPH
ncbi:MAG: hypothetical protein Q8922_10325 [Bacteroidota bacterium]|nr:hypothetical protein [Bacteroidota bacterium]MDP4233908.1 hypothetical protein [Bacteroidota bacterium]MDP4242842.1 hypothetical protein [Bacteroidota bacterium]MDP4288320.1 hypothetical protein [Bacteroidota bacterium]